MHTCVDICTLPRLGQVSDRSPGRRRNFPTQYIFHKLHHHHRPHHHHHHQHPDKSHLHQDHYHLHRHQHHNHHANHEVVTQGPGPESLMPDTYMAVMRQTIFPIDIFPVWSNCCDWILKSSSFWYYLSWTWPQIYSKRSNICQGTCTTSIFKLFEYLSRLV